MKILPQVKYGLIVKYTLLTHYQIPLFISTYIATTYLQLANVH